MNVLHHAIDLSLSLAPPLLTGKGEVQVEVLRHTAVVRLDAHELELASVATSAGPQRFSRVGDHLCIELAEPLQAGSKLTLKLAWKVSTSGKVPRFSPGQVWAGYRASAWMPTLQDSSQRATLRLSITTSPELKVAASGRADGQRPDGNGLVVHSFTLDHPTPPFLYGFAAGVFDEATQAVKDLRLRALGPAGSDLAGALRITAAIHDVLLERTGAPLAAAEYTQVFVEGDAAQEAAGVSFLAAEALDDVRKDPTEDWIFTHELAHQWFGWQLPCVDFADFWLNEGFATFMVAVVKEQRWGRPAYERELGLWRERSVRVHAEGHDAPVSLSRPSAPLRRPPQDSELQVRGVTYARGALVLDKLRRELGDAVFWAAIRAYVQSHRLPVGVRREDLRLSLEATSGRDLRGFFERWVYTSAPDL
ncbi:MAG TPA: M1 family aminopeptidase [Polyangiaceae bacterium]|nr:M1 family aminopeptidase [Polyangiaceae bacterium]